MKRLLLTLVLFLVPSFAMAQCNGVFPNNTACGNITGSSNTPRAIPLSSFPGNSPGGVSGNVQTNNGSGSFAGLTDTQLAAAVAGAASGGSAIQFLNGTGLFSTPPTFSSSASGYVPASGGGTTNFLRADGTFASPITLTPGAPVVQALNTASGSAQNTTGTIVASSTALTLASVKDFANGQGIRVNHVGPATTVGPTGGQTATPTGTAGSTTYTYAVFALDANGGVGASGGNFSTSTGNATLSSTNFNALAWGASSGSPVGYAVYGRISGSLQLIAIVAGTAYNDIGLAFATAPDYLPQTPPSATLADWLVTTVSSGGGTTSIVLGNATTTAGTTVGVYHDDTVGVQTGLTSAQNLKTPFYINPGTYYISSPLTCSIAGCHIFGAGMFAGSTIQMVSPSNDGIDLSATTASYLHDFNIVGNDGSIFNIGGSLISSSSGHQGDNFERIELQNGNNCFSISSGTWQTDFIDAQCSNNVFLLTTPGDSSIKNSLEIAPVSIPGSTTATGINVTGDPGGLRIINNKFNAGGFGYATAIFMNATISDGDFLITGNSIEGWTAAGIQIGHTGAVSFANILINGNQMSGTGIGIQFFDSASGISRISITGNVINAITAGVAMGNNAAFTIDNNVISNVTTGITMAIASATGCGIGFNNFLNATTQISDATGACVYAQVTSTKPTYP